jgi:Ca-activated chloride channel family protein
MIPFLTYPLALIALAAVPALATIYILRNRFRRRQVSSLVLWRFHVQSKSGGAKIHRLQLPLLFFLELLTLVLLVVAAAGPQLKLPQSTRPLIVVLDDSFSMRAVRDNVSAQTRAKDFLETLFRHQPPPSIRLILAGTEPRSLGSTSKTWREVDELLAQWKCWSPDAAIDSALTLAAELGKQQANILVLTDYKPAGESISNQRLEWHAFGWPLDNFAIVNASRTAFGEQDRCLLEIVNYSASVRSAKLQMQTGSNAVQNSLVRLGPHESQRLVFNIPSSAPSLRAALEADALAEDNEVQLLPPIRKRVRVQMALTNESSVRPRQPHARRDRPARGDFRESRTRHPRNRCVGQQFLELAPGRGRRDHQRLHRPVRRGQFASTRRTASRSKASSGRQPPRPIRPATCR